MSMGVIIPLTKTWVYNINMKFNKEYLAVVKQKAEILLKEKNLLVATPNWLLTELGFDGRVMESLRQAVNENNKNALLLFHNLEKYRGYWESEMEKLLILQYKHPLLKGYKQRFDFNQVRLLLQESRNKGILNHYIDISIVKRLISARKPNMQVLEHKNTSGVDDELI